jgi:hypothetical protein
VSKSISAPTQTVIKDITLTGNIIYSLAYIMNSTTICAGSESKLILLDIS